MENLETRLKNIEIRNAKKYPRKKIYLKPTKENIELVRKYRELVRKIDLDCENIKRTILGLPEDNK